MDSSMRFRKTQEGHLRQDPSLAGGPGGEEWQKTDCFPFIAIV